MSYDQKIPNVKIHTCQHTPHLEKMPPFSSEKKEKKKTCIKLGSISYGIYTCLPLHSILNMNTRDLQSKANTFRLCFQHITPKSCGSVLVQVRIPNLFFFSLMLTGFHAPHVAAGEWEDPTFQAPNLCEKHPQGQARKWFWRVWCQWKVNLFI